MSARRLRRGFMALALVVGGPAAIVVATAGPASALQFTADILTDENDAACTPGDCSFREAVEAAQANGGDDEVVLGATGTYQLTLGALDHGAADDLTVTGNGNDVNQTTAANFLVTAGNLIVSDLELLDSSELNAFSSVVGVTLTSVTVVNAGATGVSTAGPVTLTNSSLTAGGLGISALGTVTLTGSAVTSATAQGISCGGASATLTSSTVQSNQSAISCTGGATVTGGSVTSTAQAAISTGAAQITVTDATVSGLTGTSTTGPTTATRSSITGTNGLAVSSGAGNVNLTDVEVSSPGNAGVSTTGSATLTRTNVTALLAGVAANGGITITTGIIRATTGLGLSGGNGNVSVNNGDIVSGDTGVSTAGTISLTRTNVSSTGDGGVSGGGVITLNSSTIYDSAEFGINVGSTLSAVNSTISGNGGNGVVGPAASIAYSTIVGNGDAGATANLNIGLSLSLFGTVVAEPGGSASNCAGGFAINTFGYNVDDDGTCGLGAGPGDVSGLVTPLELAPLVFNSPGVHVPAVTSPLVNRIPVAACQTAPLATGVTTDERGTVRPQAALCDVGAVEVVFATDPALSFTG